MRITFFSFLMSTIWSSFLIIIIYLCRKKRFFIYQFGVASLIALYLFCILRMVFPLDFAFTRGLPLEGVFSDIYQFIGIDEFTVLEMTVLDVLLYLWVIVSAILIVRFVFRYNIAMRKVSSYVIRNDEQCKKIYARQMNNNKKKMKISVRHSSEVSVPMSIGVFNKSIVLPDEIYSDKELYYIFMHEYTHFLNGDLLVKMLIQIFCCIFWWNPIVYLLRMDLSQVLEIKCDLCITNQMGIRSKAEYLATIVSILKKINTKQKKTILCGTAELISTYCEAEVVERFKIVSANHKLQRKNKILTIVLIFAFLAFLVFSYSFVIQPYYITPMEEIETENGVQGIGSDNTYIIKNKDGTYTIVMPSGTKQNMDEKFVIDMKEQGFEVIEEEK